MGFQLELSKGRRPSADVAILGAVIKLDMDGIWAKLPERKRKDIVGEMRRILPKNAIAPARAAKIRGGWDMRNLYFFEELADPC